MIFGFIISFVSISIFTAMNNKKAFAVEEPGYVVAWDAAGPGQFPLKVTSPWFKSYETIDGAVNSSTVTLNEAQTKDATGPDGKSLVFVNIKAGSFQSNQECSIQLVVRRPNQDQSTVSIDAMTGGGEDEGDSAPDSCGDALVSAMSKIVEPDGDVTTQGPDRDSDPNTDSEQETQDDIDATTDAQDIDTDTEDTAIEPNCENMDISVGWIICPIIDGAFGIMRVVEGAIVGQLGFNLDNIGDAGTTTKIKQGHSSVLVIANILFAVGILWIVVSQAITGGGGGGFFGAYEAKKILPKLIAGIIVANLSWDLINLALKLINAIGDSVKAIMLAPFAGANTLQFDFNNGSDLILVGIGGVAAVVMAIFGFFAVSPILIGIIIAILAAIIFSIVRKGMIVVLVTFAPIMLALSPFMPNLFKRYYKLLMNLIIFYIVVMASVAGCTIIGYIIFQSSGGDKAASIGQSLTKLLGIAVYFGWMIPVLAFAKNNFDIVGKVGGSLQSAGNKWGRQFGQNRLANNGKRVQRELLKNDKKNRLAKSSYKKLVDRANYKWDNDDSKGVRRLLKPVKATRAALLKDKQAQGRRFSKERSTSKAEMVADLMGEGDKLSLDAGNKKLSAQSISAFKFGDKVNIKTFDADGNHTGTERRAIANSNELRAHLARGSKIGFQDELGREHELDGQDHDVAFAAAMQLGSSVAVPEMRALIEGSDATPSTRQLARYAISSNEGAWVPKAPDLTNKPIEKAYEDSMTSADVIGLHGSSIARAVQHQSGMLEAGIEEQKVLNRGGPVTEEQKNAILAKQLRAQQALRTSMLGMMADPQNANQAKLDSYNTGVGEGSALFISQDDIDAHRIRMNATTSTPPSTFGPSSTPPSAPGPSSTPPPTPEPGTYRDNDGNTRQSGGPGSGGVLLG